MYNNQGQVLGATAAVLPATVAYPFLSKITNIDTITLLITAIAISWGISYMGYKMFIKIRKK